MLRTDIAAAIDEVRTVFKEAKIIEVISNLITSPEEPNIEARLLKSFHTLWIGMSQLSKPAEIIAKAFNLDQFRETKTLYLLSQFRAGNNDTRTTLLPAVSAVQAAAVFGAEKMPLLSGIVRDTSTHAREVSRYTTTTGQESLVVRVVLVEEEDGVPVTAEKLSSSVGAVAAAYAVFARIKRMEAPLLVLQCDTGSDISISLLGSKPVMDLLRNLLEKIWGYWLDTAGTKRREQLKEVLETLKGVREAHELLKSGAISDEDYGRIKHDLLTASNGLVMARLTLPEFLENQEINTRQMVQKAVPQLPGPIEGGGSSGSGA